MTASPPFVRSGAYYDQLYRDKDYAGEVDSVLKWLLQSRTDVSDILELGCGTGRHAREFAIRRRRVHGVDLSEQMLAIARERSGNADLQPWLTFDGGDVRNYRTETTFDAVISLFHICSYLQTDDDVLNYLRTASAHLSIGDPLVFDFWFKPAVLSIGPSVRIKRISDDFNEVVRIAEPIHHPEIDAVDVHYTLFHRSDDQDRFGMSQERHRMRYFDLATIESLLEAAGFGMLRAESLLDGHPPSDQTWSISVLAIKTREVDV